MSCRKTLTLGGACALFACEDQPMVDWTGYFDDYAIALAPELCYACCLGRTGTTKSFLKYEPASNTLVSKATYVGPFAPRECIYDAKHQKFVSSSGGVILVFDPATETLSTFTPVAGGFSMVYVPQLERIYGHFGTDGTGQRYVGYIDLDLNIVVQLGVIPAYLGVKPFGYNLVYSPVSNSLYGGWVTGIYSGLLKFNLTTNVGSTLVGAPYGAIEVGWDSDRDLLISFGGTVREYDTATDTLVRTTAIPVAIGNLKFAPTYVSSMKKVYVIGSDPVSGYNTLCSYDTQTFAMALIDNNVDHAYYSLCNLKNGSFLVSSYNWALDIDSIKRICLT